MPEYRIVFRKWKVAYDDEDQAVKRLKDLEERLGNIKTMLKSKETTAKYCSSVAKAAEEVSGHRAYVKKMREVLQEAGNLYERTDRQVTQNISAAITKKAGFSKDTVSVAKSGLASEEEVIGSLGVIFQYMGGEKWEQAAESWKQWREMYDQLSETGKKIVTTVMKMLLGEEFVDSVILSDQLFTGADFEVSVDTLVDIFVSDKLENSITHNIMDYALSEEYSEKGTIYIERWSSQVVEGDYFGALETLAQYCVDQSIGSVWTVVKNTTEDIGTTIGDFLYDLFKTGEWLGDWTYDRVHGKS